MDQVRLLLVEDDVELRESLAEYLSLNNFQVTQARSAIECYRSVSDASHDIAIVDVGLPDQSGFELVEYLREQTELGIVMLTARGALEDRMQGYDSGADLYFVKPVNCQELSAALLNLSVRRLETIDGSGSLWGLDQESRALCNKDKGSVKLTTKEMALLEALSRAKGGTSTRESLMIELGYQDDLYGSRALDMIVGRLRKKVEDELGSTLPLHTVHGIGYCLKVVEE